MASNSIQDWKATKIKLLEDQSQQIRDEIEAIERDYDARIDDVLVAIEDVEVADQQAVELSQAQMLKIEEAQKALSVKQRRIESYRCQTPHTTGVGEVPPKSTNAKPSLSLTHSNAPTAWSALSPAVQPAPRSRSNPTTQPTLETRQIDDYLTLKACSIIVKHPERGWLELQCNVCKANSKSMTKEFLNGVRGIKNHINAKHHTKGIIVNEAHIFKSCVKRQWGLNELEIIAKELLAGGQPIEIRECSTNHGSETAAGAEEQLSNQLERGYHDNTTAQATPITQISYSFKITESHTQIYATLAPIIAKDPEKDCWAELRCPICGANAGSRGFLGGVTGLNRHIVQKHPEIFPPPVTYQDTFAKCLYRNLSLQQVEDIVNAFAIDEKPIALLLGSEPLDVAVTPSAKPNVLLETAFMEKSQERASPPIAREAHSSQITLVQPHPESIAELGVSKQPAQYYLPECGAIAYHNTTGWVELKCNLCGSNFSQSHKDYHRGIAGLTRHFTHRHKSAGERGTWKSYVLSTCVVRQFTAENIKFIQHEFKSGRKPITPEIGDATTRHTAQPSVPEPGMSVDKEEDHVLRPDMIIDEEDDQVDCIFPWGDNATEAVTTKKVIIEHPNTSLEFELSSDDDGPASKLLNTFVAATKRKHSSMEHNPRSRYIRSSRNSLGIRSIDDDMTTLASAPIQLGSTRQYSNRSSSLSQGQVYSSAEAVTPPTPNLEPDFDRYCPCTISGHDCACDPWCGRIKTCLHPRCSKNPFCLRTHIIEPTCPQLGNCKLFECLYGHDYPAKRRQIAQVHSHRPGHESHNEEDGSECRKWILLK